jgi:Ni,Fe-hydrogenase I large subunit
MKKTIKVVPMNRVEGDLEIQLEITDGTVTDACSVGTMFRGFENLLKGRAPLDGLVITPRICGICSTAHLLAAAKALDMAFNATVPANAQRVRNTTLMVEQLQNDIRHSFLLFLPDLANPVYRDLPLHAEAVRRYTPLKGETALQAIRETKKIVEIIAILGGQWPHSSFMVPGGVVCRPSVNDINQCRSLLANFRLWYEQRIIGDRLARWQAVDSRSALDAWLEESDAHRDSDLGFFIRFARRAGLDRIGKGPGNYLSYGSLDMPEGTSVRSLRAGATFFPAGFAHGTTVSPFAQEKITEDVCHSFLGGYSGGRHPFDGITMVPETGPASDGYSWAKAPRYDGLPAETGPMAELAVAGHPLICDLLTREGPSAFLRQLSRVIRPAFVLPALDCWLREIVGSGDDFYLDFTPPENGTGFGLIQAHRGALGHWVQIVDGRIDHYQVITPTAWNASPRDTHNRRGPCEEALVGTPASDGRLLAVEHVVRSFDPCLVCTVHAVDLRNDRSGRVSP